MKRGRPLWVWTAGAAAVVLVLLSALALLTPFLIDREMVRGRIASHLSSLVEGRVEIRKLSLSFLPRPHITLHHAEAIIPETIRFRSASITVYPFIQQLLRGRIEVRRIDSVAPEVSVELPETSGLEAKPVTLPLERVRDRVEPLLHSMTQHMPCLILDVRGGETLFLIQGKPYVHLKDLEGRVRLAGPLLKVSLTGTVDPGNRFSMEGAINSRDLGMEGLIHMNDFPLRTAIKPFPISLPGDLKDSSVTTSLAFESKELEDFQVTIDKISLDRKPHEQQAPLLLFRRGRLILEKSAIIVRELEGRVGKSRFSELTGRILLGEVRFLEIDSLSAGLALDDIYSWAASFKRLQALSEHLESLEGRLNIDDLTLEGPLPDPAGWRFHLEGELEGLRAESIHLPSPVSTPLGNITLDHNTFSFSNWEIHFQDATLPASGAIRNYLKDSRRAEVRFDGALGPKASRWTADFLDSPDYLRADRRVRIDNAKLVWEDAVETRFSGTLGVVEGPEIELDLKATEEALTVHHSRIVDQDSDVALTLRLKRNGLTLTFKGNLKSSTIDRILEDVPYPEGTIEGDFQAAVSLDQPMLSTVQGRLDIEGVTIPGTPIRVERASLKAVGDRVEVVSSNVIGPGDKRGYLAGKIELSEDALNLDMDLEIGGLEWEYAEIPATAAGNGRNGPFELPLRGIIRVRADYFSYAGFIWRPVQARVVFSEEATEVRVEETAICGIQTPGSIRISPSKVHVSFQAAAREQRLSHTLGCLWEAEALMSGQFGLEGELASDGGEDDFVQSLRGNLKASAEKGRIFRFHLLSRILAVANITEILRGRAPDLRGEGLAFESIFLKAHIRGASLILEEVILEGPSMNIFCIGDLDLQENTMDLTVTVAPFRTVDAIIGHIPLIGDILGGELITLPMRVTGKLDEPVVNPISPEAVGERMVDIMKRTLTLPFRMIRSVFPVDQE